MNILSDSKKINLNEQITGVFGSFKSDKSYPVHYVMTSLNYKKLSKLEVAADAFTFEQVRFEEMVQRDIDKRRVNDEILNGYLKKGKGKALFFPPIIVAVVAFDENDNPVHQFVEAIETNTNSSGYPAFVKTWDKYFSLELPLDEGNTVDIFETKNNERIGINKYFSKINYDSTKVKLVVIDGQHRYEALKAFGENAKDIDLPICVCFSPDALNNGGEDMLETLRTMFVTINNTGKQVGGHFLDLLKDDSLASSTVRMLANKWKETNIDGLKSDLQFIEWNQRESSKSNQVNSKQSITTVSMLCECLRKTVFSKPNSTQSFTYDLLDLGNNETKLNIHTDSVNVHRIYDSEFTRDQREDLEELIQNRLVGSIDLLFRAPTVYKERVLGFNKAIEFMNRKILKGDDGWKSFESNLKTFKYIDKKIAHEDVILASKKFFEQIDLKDNSESYVRLVFQQGYISTWSKIVSCYISIENKEYEKITNSFIAACEKQVFNLQYAIFSKFKSFNTGTLYKDGTPNVTVFGKKCWANLIYSSFCNDEVLDIFTTNLIASKSVSDKTAYLLKAKIKENSMDAVFEFTTDIFDNLVKDFEKNWYMKDIPLSIKNQLQELHSQTDAASKKETNIIIKNLVLKIYNERKLELEAVLDLEYTGFEPIGL